MRALLKKLGESGSEKIDARPIRIYNILKLFDVRQIYYELGGEAVEW